MRENNKVACGWAGFVRALILLLIFTGVSESRTEGDGICRVNFGGVTQ